MEKMIFMAQNYTVTGISVLETVGIEFTPLKKAFWKRVEQMHFRAVTAESREDHL